MKENALNVFSECAINKEIPLYTFKAISYLLATEKSIIDIDEVCKLMYINKKKLTNEFDKTKPIDSFLLIEKLSDGSYDIIVAEDIKLTFKIAEKKKKPKKKNKDVSIVSEDPIVIVFEFWKSVMGKTGRTTLDAKRRAIINTVLLTLTLDEIKLAIVGCANSPWHMGHNPGKKEYNSLELIFRNASNIEGFIEDAKGLSLEERVKNEEGSRPKKMEDRLDDNDWIAQKIKGLNVSKDNVQSSLSESKEKIIAIENKTATAQHVVQELKPVYDVDKLIEKSKEFFVIKEEFRNKHIEDDIEIIEDVEDVEVIEYVEIIEDVEVLIEEPSNVPLYLRMAKNKKNK